MSFVIPGITSVEVTGAVVAAAPKFYVESQDQNPPVQNTEYTLLDEVAGCELIAVRFNQANTETAAKDVTVQFIVDGVTYDNLGSGNSFNNDVGYLAGLRLQPRAASTFELYTATDQEVKALSLPETITPIYQQDSIEGHAIKVTYKMTSAAGTAQRLHARAIYMKQEAI